MVITPLDDRTRRSQIVGLRFATLPFGVRGVRDGPDRPSMGSYKLPVDTYGLSLAVLSYLAGPKSVSVRLPRIQ